MRTQQRARLRVARWRGPHRLRKLRARNPRVAEMIERVLDAHLTYLELAALLDLADAMLQTESAGRAGCVIEAGTAYGGSALVLAAAKHPERRLVLYDVFGPFPAPGEQDAEDARGRFAEIAGGRATWEGGIPFYGYVENLAEHVRRSFVEFGLDPDTNSITFVEGLIEESLAVQEPVALAHVDCDWFDPVSAALERIGPCLVIGGRVVLDDYDDWQGARRAVDAYLARAHGLERERHSRLHLVRNA